jgi:hypothetical protein
MDAQGNKMKPRTDWEKQRDLALEWAREQRDDAIGTIDYCNRHKNPRVAEMLHRDVTFLSFIMETLGNAVDPLPATEAEPEGRE